MKLSVFLLIVFPRYVFGFLTDVVDTPAKCTSLIDCLSTSNLNTVCYEGHCVPCRTSKQPCGSSSHCCAGSRCYRNQCTVLFNTGQSCRLNRQCLDINDFCIERKCTRCIPLWSTCSLELLAVPCCVGDAICRDGVCQPAHTHAQTCSTTFECANELVCLNGTCQNPFGRC